MGNATWPCVNGKRWVSLGASQDSTTPQTWFQFSGQFHYTTASPQSVAPDRSEGTPLAPSHTEYFPAHLKEDLTHC